MEDIVLVHKNDLKILVSDAVEDGIKRAIKPNEQFPDEMTYETAVRYLASKGVKKSVNTLYQYASNGKLLKAKSKNGVMLIKNDLDKNFL